MRIFDLDNLQEIWVTITRNKVRSILTGFGVFWGIFMLIILIGFGNGFKDGMMGIIDGFATNSVYFYTDMTGEAYKGYRVGRRWNFDNSDLELLRQKATTVDQISPILYGGGSDKNVVRGRKTGNYRYRGLYPAHFTIEEMNMLYGRLLNDVDISGKRKVCVIGKEVYETLFDIGEEPVGEYIRLNGIYFQVVGVVSAKSGASMTGRAERNIYLPFSTMQQMFNRGNSFHDLVCTAKKGFSAGAVEEEVKAIIKLSHEISPTDEKAVGSFNVEEEFKRINGLVSGIDILTWIVGLGALFSGIIGISNIMLVTVRERMREIGVRRALGATPLRIIMQILSESFLLTSLAGIIGFLSGVGLLAMIERGMTLGGGGEGPMMPPFVSFNLAVVALAILVASGVIAGFLPAMRALRIKAIDAIRDE